MFDDGFYDVCSLSFWIKRNNKFCYLDDIVPGLWSSQWRDIKLIESIVICICAKYIRKAKKKMVMGDIYKCFQFIIIFCRLIWPIQSIHRVNCLQITIGGNWICLSVNHKLRIYAFFTLRCSWSIWILNGWIWKYKMLMLFDGRKRKLI